MALFHTQTRRHMIKDLIAPFIDIPMFNIKYLSMHKEQMHAGALSKLLYGFASVWVIIHLLKLMDYLPVKTSKPYNPSSLYYSCMPNKMRNANFFKVRLRTFLSTLIHVLFPYCYNRVPTSSGNHGKPGKSRKKVPCMEKSWILKNPEKSWKNHGIL